MLAESTPQEIKPINETETQVAYLGVALEKATNRQNAPHLEDYYDYINDEFSLELQKKIAISFLQGDPLLIEGGTSIGKTTTTKKMCAELGWEVHYANLNGATDVEDLMGRYIPNTHDKEEGSPQYIFADGRVTSGLRQEEGKTKVIILDELNAAPPNILIRLHEVLDALERGGDVVLSEDASESVKVNKEKTKIIALMNPPGKGFLQREALDPALLRRWVYQKEVTDLPPATLANSVNVLFGLPSQGAEVAQEKFLLANEVPATREILAEIAGMPELAAKYKEFHTAAKKLVGTRKIGQDQPQPFTYDDREEPRRVRNFVARFYRGDSNQTFQDALRYYYAGKILDPQDKAKLEELIHHVEYIPPKTESKRRGLEQPSTRQGATEALLQNPAVPEAIKQRVKAIEGKTATPEAESGQTSLEDAERIMGANFLGPEIIKQTFGIEVKETPPIQFSSEELERAQELGEQLILFVDQAADGQDLSMAKMNEVRNGKAADGKQLLYKWESGSKKEWYEKETLFSELTPTAGWRLVSPEVIPNSTDKDYVDQTQAVADYLTNEVYKGVPLPEKYQDALKSFQEQKEEIKELLGSNWNKAGERLEGLSLTKLTRETPPEALYRLILAEKKSGKKSLATKWTWTKTRSLDGGFVRVGPFGVGGVRVDGDEPGYSRGPLGACLSRS